MRYINGKADHSSGAGSSKGRTSWSATPETLDYISFIGFFVYYVNNLHAPSSPDLPRNDSGTTLSPISSAQTAPCSPPIDTSCQPCMILILCGYSYGSLITTLLPDTESILKRFTNVTTGSAEAEIRLRALHLSVQWNRDALARRRSQRDRTLGAQEKAVVIGGEESEPGTRRPSKDSRRSIDNIRRSVDFSRRKLGLRHTKSGEAEAHPLEPGIPPTTAPLLSSYYLLISPLRPPISSLMTMFSKVRPHGSPNDPLSTNLQGHNAPDTDRNLVTNATLAVYGDKDFFVSQKKLRKWVEDLAGRPRSTFQFREIAGAGHFWQEEGVEAQLRTSIREWLRDILSR